MENDRNECQVTSLDERRLQRLEQAIAVTRTKLDVVGIRLEWLGRKLLSTELERAELRRTLAERAWEVNMLRHRLKHDQQTQENQREQTPVAVACKSSMTD